MAEATAIFHSSLEAIQNTLSSEDRASFRTFSNHKDMVAEAKLLCEQYAQKSRLARCCKKIAGFANAFAPYFDVVNIFVQIKPEWAGWFWGSIRLIFQLGSNLAVFLGNVSEMFEKIAFTLPQYQAWFDLCRVHVKEKDKNRLGYALSFVYADMIEFCLHIYRIFSRAKRGSSFLNRATMTGNLLWRPFQSRFSNLLQRLQKHQQWFETEAMIQQHELITQHYESFVDYLKASEEQNEIEKHKELIEEKRWYREQVEKVVQWISSPRYRDIYERVKRDRFPGSCKEFFLESYYLSWRNFGFQSETFGNPDGLEKDWLSRILYVQAKPGYGKTYLSSMIIDDLLANAQDLVLDDDDAPAVAFFHFSSSGRWGINSPEGALQSIASQLVTTHKADKLTIDALSMLLNETGSGQCQASTDDILVLLGILLRRHPTFIVIDAVDECDEPDRLLQHLMGMCQTHDCRLLLLSRPTINLSSPLLANAPKEVESCVLALTGSLNFEDIRRFLKAHLQTLASSGAFGSRKFREIEEISSALAQHANGMFLWARLFVNYLWCSALTPRERWIALTRPAQLEGIENLYDRILSVLGKNNEREKAVAGDIIRWISATLYPLSTPSLHMALAIIPGQPTSQLQYLNNFPECIPRITCALVEITEIGNLDFIHLSFREYLESNADKAEILSLQDTAAVNLHLATKCLSYLAYDVPARPLQGVRPLDIPGCGWLEEASASHIEATLEVQDQVSAAESESLEQLTKRHPLLRYAALSWCTHLMRAHGSENEEILKDPTTSRLSVERSQSRLDELLKGGNSWTSILARFLVDRRSVTTWVEACCIFDYLPRLTQLLPQLEYLRERGSAKRMEDRELWWVLSGMQQLAGALNGLWDQHAKSLMQNPSLIWQDRITAAEDKHFWPVWRDRPWIFEGESNDDDNGANARFLPGFGNERKRQRTEDYLHRYVS